MTIRWTVFQNPVLHEKGDRVKLTMTGKFLPYRYYGAEQGIPAFGYRES